MYEESKRRYYDRNKDTVKAKARGRTLREVCQRGVAQAAARCRQRGWPELDFDADWMFAEVERQGYLCAATGMRFSLYLPRGEKHRPLIPSLDRIDSDLPYRKDNIRVVMAAFNSIRKHYPDSVFALVARGFLGKLVEK